MKPIVWALLLTGVSLNAAAQLLLKAATRATGPLVSDSGRVAWPAAITVLTQLPLWLSLACYAVSIGIWTLTLSRVPVSVAYPMLSIGYVINAVAAAMLFGELLGASRIFGIVLICAGVALLARGA